MRTGQQVGGHLTGKDGHTWKCVVYAVVYAVRLQAGRNEMARRCKFPLVDLGQQAVEGCSQEDWSMKWTTMPLKRTPKSDHSDEIAQHFAVWDDLW